MVLCMKTLHISSTEREEMIDITTEVQTLVTQEKILEGFLIVYVPHTTAGVTINEGADPDVQRDLIRTLQKLVPEHASYSHSEGNSDAHIKASLLGSSATVLIHEGTLLLGTWQHLFFYEADGPRRRTAYVQFVKNR
jgi:secondary thiamine-phosphate synthase enzyme